VIKIKGIEGRVTLGHAIGEIRRDAQNIAADLHPDSLSMKSIREAREQADKRIAKSGITVIP